MKKMYSILIISMIMFYANIQISAQNSRKQPIDANWRFHLGDIKSANNPEFNDSEWRLLNLPHDWSVEGNFSAENASGTGYLPGGIGWYRKEFVLSEENNSKHYTIQFDGVYENSEVWINGHYLGKRPFGFISFYYDLTPFLHFGNQKNIIAVRVDNSHVADSRWYTGSGIYRHVWLYVTNEIQISHWGTFISTPIVNEKSANVRVINSVENKTNENKALELINKIIDSDGKTVSQKSSTISFQPNTKYEFDQTILVEQPTLWSIDNPYLYTAISELYDGNKVVDQISTKFGIREIHFDTDKGFFLNGKATKIKGVCLHNDAGALGSAVPDREWKRRLELMKEMGSNAIRTSHNPPSPELLDLCDEMGFLVMDEAFDEWEIGKKKWIKGRNLGFDKGASGVEKYYSQHGYSDFFTEWSKQDIQDMVRRDRNHPSIILWSIGNEIDYPNDPYSDPSRDNYKSWRPQGYKLTEIARRLSNNIKEIDDTRPVTAAVANIPFSNEIGYSAILDVVGYNYQEQFYNNDRSEFPDRKMIGSENGDALDSWLVVRDNNYMPGQFLWTGIDYLGEAGEFPNRSNKAGLVDISDFKKPGFYYRQSLWTEKPMVYISCFEPGKDRRRFLLVESWNWEKNNTKNLSVVAFSNCDSVALYLNDKLLGVKERCDTSISSLTWDVPFEAGKIKAVAIKNNKEVSEHVIKTAEEPNKIVLVSDQNSLIADGKDFTSVKILIQDENGILVPYAENKISLKISGPANNLGMSNGDHNNVDAFKSNQYNTFQGKAHVFIQSNGEQGLIHIEASSNGLISGKLELKCK